METVWIINGAGWSIIAYFSLSIIYRLLRGLWIFKLGNALGYSVQFKPQANSWAIVTGSTDGIGLAYVRQFHKRGYNLLLISRNQLKLQDVRDQLRSTNNGSQQIVLHVADFSKIDIYDDIRVKIMDIVTQKNGHIDVLINNVGMFYDEPDYFLSPKVAKYNDIIINVNSLSCCKMTSLVIPYMVDQSNGVILNISSFTALSPSPMLSLYAGTKSFVDIFSRSIASEYYSKGIIIQSIVAGFVLTNMIQSTIKKRNLFVPTAESFVDSQLKTVGLDDQTAGYWSHELMAYFSRNVVPLVLGKDIILTLTYLLMKFLKYKKS